MNPQDWSKLESESFKGVIMNKTLEQALPTLDDKNQKYLIDEVQRLRAALLRIYIEDITYDGAFKIARETLFGELE